MNEHKIIFGELQNVLTEQLTLYGSWLLFIDTYIMENDNEIATFRMTMRFSERKNVGRNSKQFL